MTNTEHKSDIAKEPDTALAGELWGAIWEYFI